MRIRLVLVLLLAGSAVPASAQDGYWQPTPSALPASLTPAVASTPRDPVALVMRRNRAQGALIGAVMGAVAGVVVANYACVRVPDTGGADEICKAAGLGLGIIVGAIVGGIIGVPSGSATTP